MTSTAVPTKQRLMALQRCVCCRSHLPPDWALHRGGALVIEGAEGVAVEGCTFTRVDGNAVMLSGYTRDVLLADNDFSWLGDCAMAAWGYTNDDDHDGTDGEQARALQDNRSHRTQCN